MEPQPQVITEICLRHQFRLLCSGCYLFWSHSLALPPSTKMSLANTFYNTLVKKNSVFVATIFATAFAFEVAFDTTSTKVWDNLNKGVSTRLFLILSSNFFFVFQRTLEAQANIEPLVSTQIESTSSCLDLRSSMLLKCTIRIDFTSPSSHHHFIQHFCFIRNVLLTHLFLR